VVPATVRRALLVACAALAHAACLFDGTTRPPQDLKRLWRQFLEMPEERALALAGDPKRGRWVAGASGGHASREEAESAALAECRKRRAQRRMQDPCRLYGVGDAIVWDPP
jgi:hypothetical protein